MVTATGDQAKREVGNAVSTVDASVLVANGPVVQHERPAGRQGAGRAGAAGSTTGTGGRVRIRGNSSLSLSNNPIYVVDGIRMTSDVNSSSIGIGGSDPEPGERPEPRRDRVDRRGPGSVARPRSTAPTPPTASS